jgi:predicted nucleic acid-binding protein
MKAYADSSFITALYVAEPFTRKAQALAMTRAPLPFTPWHRLEVRNAIRCASGQAQAKAAIQLLDGDLRERTVVAHHGVDWTDCLRKAEELSRDFNPGVGASSPDLFHVACAMELGLTEFLSFDETQTRLAKAAGLRVKGL